MAKIDTLSDSRVRMEIDVTAEEFDQALDTAFENIRKDVEIKGFRKGKVTRAIYEKHRGVETLYEDALNHIIDEAYYRTVQQEDVHVVAPPKIDFDVSSVKKGQGFMFTAIVAVKPEVKLGEYKGFAYEQPSVEVSDEDVHAEIEKLREQQAELVIKEDGALEKGDTVVFDFEGFLDGEPFEGGKAENHELEIGSGRFIPGFEDKMVGMRPGEERDLDITFPDNYEAEHLKGKASVFKVKVHEIKVKRLPELTDAFVKELEREDVETVDALLKKTREDLVAQKEKDARNKTVDFAVGKAVEHAEMIVPKDMVEQEKNRQIDNVKRQAQQYNIDYETYLQLSRIDKETFEKNMEEQAEKTLKTKLTVEAVSKKEAVTATQEELDKKYEELSKLYNLDVEQIRSQVAPSAVEQEVVFGKTVDLLVDALKTE